jgi:hypothetical protein
MTKGELVKELSRRAGVKRKEAGKVLNAFIQVVMEKLKNGEITPKTMMWKPGLQKWKRAGRIDDFQPLLQKFQEWVETQDQERTIVTQIPLPTRRTSAMNLPPIPEETAVHGSDTQDTSSVGKDSQSEISSVSNFFGTAKVAAAFFDV